MSELIQVEQLQQILDTPGLIILDCRADLQDRNSAHALYQQGHISGALQADLESDLSSPHLPGLTGRHPLPSVEQWRQTLARWGIEIGSQVVVYDQGNSMFAARAWWMLKWAGIDRVQVLDGGMTRWRLLGGDCESLVPQPEPSNIQIKPNPDWTISAQALQDRAASTRVLDARALNRYKGEVEPLDAKAGHIPGAMNADFTKNLAADGRFLSPAGLADRFAALPDGPLVCYCGSGVTACHNLLALTQSGRAMPTLYPGSWSEWITDPQRAIGLGIEGTVW
ncbi:sulfurtransferase [Reinekea sp.]|jgi:thiosulfate/3-mercaptopyruvate sulfurtransferase|uniref:sulfurtransferase n=1 Tax=Reinekea sp. TaxID=1970455 RepID=UPI002A7F8A1A|nr:sulfurtransferase [Reinekea sp.]